MAELYKAGDEVIVSVKDLIAKYHPDLAMHDDEIAILFKDKATQVGDVVVLGKSTKASPILALLSEKPYKFVITLAADEWSSLTDKQKLALLDHHLCACKAKEDAQTGETKFWIQPPDVGFYQAELERHGFWRTSGSPAPKNILEEMFGTED